MEGGLKNLDRPPRVRWCWVEVTTDRSILGNRDQSQATRGKYLIGYGGGGFQKPRPNRGFDETERCGKTFQSYHDSQKSERERVSLSSEKKKSRGSKSQKR